MHVQAEAGAFVRQLFDKSALYFRSSRKVSVPWTRAHLAALPIFLLGLAGLWFVGDAFNSKLFALVGALAGGAIGMLIALPLHHYLVPLVKPEK